MPVRQFFETLKFYAVSSLGINTRTNFDNKIALQVQEQQGVSKVSLIGSKEWPHPTPTTFVLSSSVSAAVLLLIDVGRQEKAQTVRSVP